MTSLKDLVGRTFPPYRFVVEEGKIVEFTRILQLTDPIYTDGAVAKDCGLSGPLAPPTYSVATAHWTPTPTPLSQVLDLTRLLAAGNEWIYHQPLLAGDELAVASTVESVEEKTGKRGPMSILRVRSDFQRGDELVLTYTFTLIQFGDDKAEKK